jgi:hypothetical protein
MKLLPIFAYNIAVQPTNYIVTISIESIYFADRVWGFKNLKKRCANEQ